MTDEVKRGRAEWCPVCGKANIAGHKWCHGPVTDTHEKARFEFVDVVPASDFDRVCGERDALGAALTAAFGDRTVEYRVIAGDGSGLCAAERTLEDAERTKRERDESYPDAARGPWVIEQREVAAWRRTGGQNDE